jgi:hypothetical protein
MTVRAKFRCSTVTTTQWAPGQSDLPRTYKFQAAYDTSIPEDQRYAKSTPTGSLEMQVDNPAVTFEPGKSYYLDFTPAD